MSTKSCEPRLAIDDLHLAYGSNAVLRGVSLQLRAGELVGLIGPNGSGKSSLLRAIAGLQPGQRGRVRIDGEDIADDIVAARRRLGFAVEPPLLPERLSGRQCLELLAELRERESALADSWQLAESLGLGDWLARPVGSYSLGTRQKLAIVLALFDDPPLLVLDEVLNGLDPLAAFELKQALRARAGRGASILLATHGLEVAERFLDRAVLLLDGRIAADWDAAELARLRADPDGGLEHAVAELLRARRDAIQGASR